MEQEKRNATENACLQNVVCRMDAKEMTDWVWELPERVPLHFPRYQSVFRCFDMEGRDVLMGGAGRLAGLRVTVSRTGCTGRVDLDGQTVFTMERPAAPEYDTIPFGEVFALCNQLRNKLRELIGPEYDDVPVVGGIRSILLRDEPQEIADYYLPELELFGTDGDFRLFTASHIPGDTALTPLHPRPGRTSCRALHKEDCPDKALYTQRMAHVLEALQRDELQKVVVARRCTVTPDEEFDPRDYAAYLYDRYFQEYYYLFRQGGDCWTGISPEIIMKQQGDEAVTKPLAGTRKKTDDPAQNEAIRRDLTSTNKDIVEHEHALYFMVRQLERSGIGQVQIDRNKTVLETPYAFHIKSEISMHLKAGVSCFDIIGAIYPPATVWGIPVDKTEHLLARTEPFDRDCFTGVYGYWTFSGAADTALVIRSARLSGGTVSLYAGGGIVKYSDIDAEFDETVNKMRPLLSYFSGV